MTDRLMQRAYRRRDGHRDDADGIPVTSTGLKLFALDELYEVVRLHPDTGIPDWATTGHFWSVTRSDAELSVVCPQDDVPPDASAERGWCALEVAGPLDFSLTGVVASLVTPLAEDEIPLFVVSTFETDYLLVRERDLHRSVEALTGAGHSVDGGKPLGSGEMTHTSRIWWSWRHEPCGSVR